MTQNATTQHPAGHRTRAGAAAGVAIWFGVQINRDVERTGILAGHVRATDRGRAEVRWTWPSGNPRHIVTIDVDPRDGATFLVRSYDDDEYTEPYLEHNAATPHDAATAVASARRQADAIARRDAASRPVPFGTACDDGCEQSVVVVFDLYAPTHEDAARHLAGLLGAVRHDDAVDSWWYPEPQDKHIDRNDCDPMVLCPVEPDPPCTCGTDAQFGRHGRACEAYDGWRE